MLIEVYRMSDSCDDSDIEILQESQRKTLWIVLGINSVMFLAILAGALYSQSSVLLADSFDDLGDALTYSLSLFVVSKGATAKAKVALFKGGLILLAACAVAAQIVYTLYVPSTPVFEVMGVFGFLGLVANSFCVYLLLRYRHQDVNMSSVWECSRNDLASNISVLAAAGAVWLTGSGWPDIVIALVLVGLLLRSGLRVMSSAKVELRAAS